MPKNIILWFEFVVVVIPTTLVVGISTLFLPFGALLRPVWIIPSYLGGVFGVYALWRMFLLMVYQNGNKSTNIIYYYVIGVFGLHIFCFKAFENGITIEQYIKFVSSGFVLPIIVGAHWVYLIWLKDQKKT